MSKLIYKWNATLTYEEQGEVEVDSEDLEAYIDNYFKDLPDRMRVPKRDPYALRQAIAEHLQAQWEVTHELPTGCTVGEVIEREVTLVEGDSQYDPNEEEEL